MAIGIDISYLVFKYFGLDAVDNGIVTLRSPNSSTSDKVFAVVGAGFATATGKVEV